MRTSYLNRPYSTETVDPEPSRLFLDFLFENRVMYGMIGIDIETKPHSALPERMEGVHFASPEAREQFVSEAAARTDCLEVGVIQFMDSAGQFGYIDGVNEVEILREFWKFMATLREGSSPYPLFVHHNGVSFDIHNLDARTAMLSSFEGLGGVEPIEFVKDTRYGDRFGLPQLDVGLAFTHGNRGMPKLHYLAQNLFLPGKPSQSAKEAVDLLAGTPEEQAKAIEYMCYDVRTPIQIAFLGNLLRRQYLMGLGGPRQAPVMRMPYVLPESLVRVPAKKFTEPLPEAYAELVTLAPKFVSKRSQLDGMNTEKLFPGVSPEVAELIDALGENRMAGFLAQPLFQDFCRVVRYQADLPENSELRPTIAPVKIGYSKEPIARTVKKPTLIEMEPAPQQAPAATSADLLTF